MILVDTSVVIDYARGKDPKLIALLPTLLPSFVESLALNYCAVRATQNIGGIY